MATQTTKELDALYVTIRVEDKPFLQSAASITAGLDTLEKKFVSFGQNVSAAFSGGMKDASRSLANIGRFIDAVSTLTAGAGGVGDITKVVGPLKKFAQRFNRDVTDELIKADTQTATKTLSKLASFLRVARDLPANIDLSGVTTPLKDFAVAFKRDVASVLNGPEVMDASKALANISRFLGVFKSETFDASKIKDISSPLKSFAENFKNNIASFMTGPDVQSATTALSRVGSFLRALSGLPDTKTLNAKTHGMAGILQTMFGSLAATAQNNAGFDLASKTVGRLANFARSMMKFDVNVLAGQIDPIKNFVAGIGGADATKAAPVVDVLNKMGLALNRLNKHAGNTSNFNTIGNDVAVLMAVFGRAASWAMSAKTTVDALGKVATVLNRVAKVNVNAATAAGQATLAVMNSLNALTVGPNVNASLNALERLSKVMGRVSRTGQRTGSPTPPVAPPGGGGGGGWFGWLGGFFGGGPSLASRLRTTAAAANTGGNSFGLLGRNIEYTADRADRLIGALTSTHAIIVGIGTMAGRQFGLLDDALTRLAAHSQDWEQSNRGMLQSAVMDLSGRSRTGAVDLAKGLDILTSNGMSAAMAMKAMGIAENFALSSGMEMEAATRRIVDVQRNLGMNSTNVAEHYANMTRLSDIFVGVAPKVGSTVDQLTEAFRGRFAGAMHSANMSMEEGIAMMGALSTIGGRFRGGTGGEFGARLLGITSVLNANNAVQWRNLLGQELYDEGGKMLPIDQIADLLTERLGTEGSKQRTNRIVAAGFKSENVNVLSALIGLGPEIRKVLAEIEKVGGVSAKSADLMRRTFMGQMTTLYNNAINVATVIGERLAPIIFVFTDAIASAAKWFTALNPAIQQLIVGATAAAFAAYPLYLSLMYIGGLALKPFFMIGSAFMTMARFAMFAGSAILVLIGTIASFAISSVSFVVSITKGVISTLMTINSVVGNIIYTVADVAVAAGKVIGNALGSVALFAIGAIIDAFHFFSLTFRQMVDVVRDLGAAVWKVGLNAIVALGSLLFSLFTSILPLIISVVAAIMALPFILMAVSAAGAALAAVVATMGIGIAQLGVAIGGGLLALWAGFKVAIAGTFAWVAGKMDDLREGAVSVWSSFKSGAAEALVSIGNALSKIAGFFWNIKDNAKIVGEWWSVNWKAAIEDIGNVIVTTIENAMTNVARLLSAASSAIYVLFKPIGYFLEALFVRSFGWFGANWTNMLSDAATIFKTFVSNIAQNFMTLLPVFDALADYIAAQIFNFGWADHERKKAATKLQAEIAYFTGDTDKLVKSMAILRPDLSKEDVIAKAKNAPQLRGPLDDLPALKTRGSDLAGMMNALTTSFADDSPVFAKKAWGIMSGAFSTMKPLLEGFIGKAPWTELMSKLNLNLPEGFMGPLMEAFTGSTRKVVESEGAGQMIGKGGPGWTFRQTSMARMEVGGEFATNLERQQLSVLQAIQRDTAVIAAANKDMRPAIFKPMKPVREGGD